MWIATAAMSTNSMSLMRASRIFVLPLRRPGLKSLPSDLVRRKISSDAVRKACLRSKEDSKECRGQDTPLFDAAADVKGPGGAAVEMHCLFHVCVEGCNHALQFWWAANLWKDLEETVSADKIKRLCEVNESDI